MGVFYSHNRLDEDKTEGFLKKRSSLWLDLNDQYIDIVDEAALSNAKTSEFREGAGATGPVHKATLDGHTVVLKHLNNAYVRMMGANRVKQEVVAHARVSHSEFAATLRGVIIRGSLVVDRAKLWGLFPIGRPRVVSDTRDLYLIMPYYDGDLGAVFDAVNATASGAVGDDKRLELAKKMALCIEELHRLRCVHGDIKLENFLVKLPPLAASGHAQSLQHITFQERIRATPVSAIHVVVSDYGFSTVRVGDQAETKNGLGGATITYLAPEIGAYDDCTYASDVYATALCVKEMMIGKRMSLREPKLQMFRAATVPQRRLQTVLDACLAEDPKARPHISALVSVLRDLTKLPTVF